MNLETSLSTDLWEAVRTNYGKRNFTGAILDAFYFLSDLLRKKSGSEGDGSTLIGQALGGAAPKIKLNKLQSESEQNIQKGVETLLRGFYQAIRNPRSHDKVTDTEEDAQVLIIFINYLVRQIDQAKAQFSHQDFLKRVLDPDFVPQQRYAELLVAEIPTGQRLEVFLNTYRSKDAWVPSNLRHFFDALFVQLNAEELKQVYEVISEELKSVEDESVIRQIIGSFSASIWPLLDEVARLRIENRLIRSIREGQYDRRQKRCRGGALGTWAKSLFPHFLLKTEAIRAISDKLNSSSAEDQDYVLEYFYYHLDSLAKPMPPTFERTLKRMLKAGNGRVFDAMLIGGWSYDTWTDDLRKAYDEFSIVAEVDPDPDDIPF